jgi:hypothetical protein
MNKTHTHAHTHTHHTHTTPAYPAHASVLAAQAACPRLLASVENSQNVSGRIHLLYKSTIARTFESVRFLEEEEEEEEEEGLVCAHYHASSAFVGSKFVLHVVNSF